MASSSDRLKDPACKPPASGGFKDAVASNASCASFLTSELNAFYLVGDTRLTSSAGDRRLSCVLTSAACSELAMLKLELGDSLETPVKGAIFLPAFSFTAELALLFAMISGAAPAAAAAVVLSRSGESSSVGDAWLNGFGFDGALNVICVRRA
eukprot:CAMPEP_0169253318 /NCGR_PEP_ID=MMETSP1016-20121227/38540_1 /TAXON_ID=342587 /ORGANISM="Karlodinium micrum, Strain CCMP2283" /LENGTH=152 /DNA_ID=CAMNT_0009334629 /DNA_START=168 /DNA_END=626 /DNA_ORIENTATION=-